MRMDVRARRGRAAEPGADLVTRDDGLDEPMARESLLLGNGERGGNHVNGGMASTQPNDRNEECASTA